MADVAADDDDNHDMVHGPPFTIPHPVCFWFVNVQPTSHGLYPQNFGSRQPLSAATYLWATDLRKSAF